MGTVYSDIRTSERALPREAVSVTKQYGRKRGGHAVYEASSLAANEVIELHKLPDGAKLYPFCKLICDDLGTGVNISVGYAAYTKADGTAVAADPDAFLASTDVASAATTTDFANTLALGAGTLVDANEDGFVITATILDLSLIHI